MSRGLDEKSLPQSVEGYRKMLKKYVSTFNDKLFDSFEVIYRELHISGYYRGNLRSTDTVKGALKTAKLFIEKIGG